MAQIRCPDDHAHEADFFANQAIDRVLNPVKSTKIPPHYAVVAAKHERCSVGQSTCVLLPRA